MKKLLHLAATVLALTVLLGTSALAATIEELQRPYLKLMHVPEAQKLSKGEGVIVAVIDTGVDAGHPDLKGALLPGYHVNQKSAEAANFDSDGHGTAMSGIIAGRGGGYNNVLGVAPRAKILPVAINFDADNTAATLAAAIRWAVDHGATVLNMSLARPSYDPVSRVEIEAVAYAQSKGAILIVSSGNTVDLTGGNNLAGLPGVLAVAASTQAGGEYLGSEKRDYNAIAAPGKDIVTTGARNIHSTGFASDSGTSPATAIVSGVAALIKSKYPSIDGANIVNRLIKTAVDKGEPGRDKTFGYGIVDAYAAVNANIPTVDKNPLGVTAVSSPANSTANQNPAKKPSLASNIIPIVGLLAVVGGLAFTIAQIIRSRRRKTPPAGPAASPPTMPQGPGVPPVFQ